MSLIKAEASVALRILRYPLTLLILGFAAFTALYGLCLIVAARPAALHHSPVQPLVVLACAGLTIWLYRIFQARVEARRDDEFDPKGAVSELGRGLAAGFGLFSTVVLAVWMAGCIEFAGLRGGIGNLWGMLSMAISSALFEELLFRGIVFRQLEALVGSWIALGLTSAFFGLAHLGNPDATLFAAFAIAVEAGLLLGAAFMLTRRLWLPIGIHAAWNFTQGWIFSVPVSGGKAPEGLLRTSLVGPDWLTGGAFGLEASLVALVIALLAGLALLRAAILKQGLIAPRWQRKQAQTPGELT